VRSNETIVGVSQDTMNPLKRRVTIFIGTLSSKQRTNGHKIKTIVKEVRGVFGTYMRWKNLRTTTKMQKLSDYPSSSNRLVKFLSCSR
jgi:hypothetical protein